MQRVGVSKKQNDKADTKRGFNTIWRNRKATQYRKACSLKFTQRAKAAELSMLKPVKRLEPARPIYMLKVEAYVYKKSEKLFVT